MCLCLKNIVTQHRSRVWPSVPPFTLCKATPRSMMGLGSPSADMPAYISASMSRKAIVCTEGASIINLHQGSSSVTIGERYDYLVAHEGLIVTLAVANSELGVPPVAESRDDLEHGPVLVPLVLQELYPLVGDGPAA